MVRSTKFKAQLATRSETVVASFHYHHDTVCVTTDVGRLESQTRYRLVFLNNRSMYLCKKYAVSILVIH